jgi:hypothetical protein
VDASSELLSVGSDESAHVEHQNVIQVGVFRRLEQPGQELDRVCGGYAAGVFPSPAHTFRGAVKREESTR